MQKRKQKFKKGWYREVEQQERTRQRGNWNCFSFLSSCFLRGGVEESTKQRKREGKKERKKKGSQQGGERYRERYRERERERERKRQRSTNREGLTTKQQKHCLSGKKCLLFWQSKKKEQITKTIKKTKGAKETQTSAFAISLEICRILGWVLERQVFRDWPLQSCKPPNPPKR